MTSKGVEMNIMIKYSSILFLKDGLLFSKSQKTPHLQDYRFYVIGTINIQWLIFQEIFGYMLSDFEKNWVFFGWFLHTRKYIGEFWK